MTDRIPPQAIEEEMAVLGAILMYGKAITEVQEFLEIESFYKNAHKTIYQSMMNLYNGNTEIDHITIASGLVKMEKLDEIGGAYYLTELTKDIVSSANIKTHAKIIAEKALLRKIIDIGINIEERGYAQNTSAEDIICKSQQEILSLTLKTQKKYSKWDDVLHKSMDILSKYHDQKKGIIGIPTGIFDLDNKLGGLKKGDLIIIAARPSMGKTGFAINNLALNAAKSGTPTGIFSLEMEDTSLVMRSIAAEAKVDHHKMTHGKLVDEEWQKIASEIHKIYGIPILIDDSPSLNIMNIRSKARQMKVEHDVGLLIIDYLQLMSSHQRFENRDTEVGNISKNMKALARELDTPVVLLCQLNRECEKRINKRPILSDLRESGNIEQDADVVIFIYRPEVYSISGNSEIIIAKSRSGPVGSVDVCFLKEQIVFKNMDTTHSETGSIYDAEKDIF